MDRAARVLTRLDRAADRQSALLSSRFVGAAQGGACRRSHTDRSRWASNSVIVSACANPKLPCMLREDSRSRKVKASECLGTYAGNMRRSLFHQSHSFAYWLPFCMYSQQLILWLSPPARRRGLKHPVAHPTPVRWPAVASCAEAWIETTSPRRDHDAFRVASCAEAWIETVKALLDRAERKVASCAEAWIETRQRLIGRLVALSPPARRRGLKPGGDAASHRGCRSPPARRRGLKHGHRSPAHAGGGRLLRGGVD
ncbi:hypothetical protein [Azospirillum argentinense]